MWNGLKPGQKPTLSPTVALKVRNSACLQLLNKILHWFPCLSAKMGLEKAFPPALLGSGVLLRGAWWCTAADQAVLLRSHCGFIPVVAPRGWETTSLPPSPLPSSALPSPPLEVG